MFKKNQGVGFGGGSQNIEKIKDLSPNRIITEFRILFGNFHSLQALRDSHINNPSPTGSSPSDVSIINAKLKARGEYLQALSKALPEEFFEGGIGAEPINTLYDQMKALYDEEDPEKEIKTELNELGFDKQYKDLMSAWDSAEKFSKFITPLANLSKVFGDTLGKIGKVLDDSVTAGANNAQLENYKIRHHSCILTEYMNIAAKDVRNKHLEYRYYLDDISMESIFLQTNSFQNYHLFSRKYFHH